MIQIKNIEKNNPFLLINLIFAFFPISFILGSLIVNLNVLLFCFGGIFYLRSKIFKHKYPNIINIVFLLFLLIFISTAVSFIKTLYFNNYNDWDLDGFLKSILYFRYFLFIIIIYLLNKFDFLNFKFFFLTASLSSLILSLDLIFQYNFGFNTTGLEGNALRNSGFFGDEYVAGGYLQRFSFFGLLFAIFFLKDKSYLKYISIPILACILAGGIFSSGNKMPMTMFIFGFIIILFFNMKIKKIVLFSLTSVLIFLSFMFWSNQNIKSMYSAFFNHAQNTITFTDKTIIEAIPVIKDCKDLNKKLTTKCKFFKEKLGPDSGVIWESFHRRLFLTAIDTWKFNKIIGNGIKSFRHDCHRLRDHSDTNTDEDLIPGMKNRLCSNHPHNYYLEILTETGMVGITIVVILILLILSIVIKNNKFINGKNVESYIYLAATISLVLETFPVKSSGSIFTTNNATYVMLMLSIFLCYEKLLKIKTE